LKKTDERKNRQALSSYFEDEPGRRSAAKLLSKDEARRIVVNIAKPPECWAANPLPVNRADKQPAPINLINCASDVRVARPFRCSSYFPIAPGILYKPVTPVQHRMIGILRCRGLLYPPFRKEHARDRVPLLP
jgi:hypothetical protein